MTPQVNRIARTLRRWSKQHDYMSLDNLKTVLDTLGCRVIGHGMYGVVVDCDDFVLKVFDASDEAYLDFVDFCEKIGPCRHLPAILWDKQIDENWWAICLEKLEPFSIDGNENPKSPYFIRWRYKKMLDRINGSNKSTGRKELDAIVDLLDEARETEGHFEDMHDGNVMLRGYTLVITDPWC